MNALLIMAAYEKIYRKNKLLQVSFESRFSDFGKDEDCILAFIHSS